MGVGPSGTANGGSDGRFDLFGAPPFMNLADERSLEAGSGAAKNGLLKRAVEPLLS
jgi:hypothetical protein